MLDELDERIAAAGHMAVDEKRIAETLQAIAAERATAVRARRRRVFVPAISMGLVLGVMGTGAVAATQWGPWRYVPDADIVIARNWTDLSGAALGSCETRLAVDSLSGEQRDAARRYLDRVDSDTVAPDAENVASLLVAVDRPDDLGLLIEGANVADFDITHTGPTWDERWSNARIMQSGLEMEIFGTMADEMVDRWPDLGNKLTANSETQCTTDPAWLRAQ